MEVKIFQAHSPKILETKINEFLEDSCSDVVDIKYHIHISPYIRTSHGNTTYTALVVLSSVHMHSTMGLKDKLVIVHNQHCYGIVGTPTGVFLDDAELCIGDVVKFEACDVYNENIGVIAMFGNVVGIQGIASRPLSTVETITSIVKSHKVLKSDDTIWRGTGFTSCKLII